jgi:hypothetical protein
VTTTQISLAVAVLAAVLAGWCLHAWFWPWTYCRRCDGRRGQGQGSTRRGWNRCRKCGPLGTKTPGEQVRHTARVISKATGLPVRGSKQDTRGK